MESRESRTAPGVVFTPERLAEALFLGLPAPPGERDPLALLDPACGDGRLLAAALDVSRRRGHRGAVVLRGIEIEPAAAERARGRLAERARADGRAVEVGIWTADALDPALAWPAGSILANPPWVSLSGRQRRPLEPGRARRYRSAWAAMAGWPSLHGAFLERIARHCREHRAGARVLLPAPLCSLARYAPARAAATAHAALVGPPVELAEGTFGAVSEPAVIVTLRGRRRVVAGAGDPWQVAGGRAAALLGRLREYPRLPPAAFADPGVHTGNAAALLVERGHPELWPGLREGRDLSPFELRPPRLGLRTDVERGPDRRFRAAALERYRSVPILLRQTAQRPEAALHTAPTYFRNSLLACTPPDGLDPAFCVAVLNGPVAAAWHRASFADARQRAFPQVKVSHLRSQPFPIVRRDADPALHDRLAGLVRALRPGSARFGDHVRELATEALRAFHLEPELEELCRSTAEGP